MYKNYLYNVILFIYMSFYSVFTIACECDTTGLEQDYENASVVFLGYLTSGKQVFKEITYYKDPRYPNISIREKNISLEKRSELESRTIKKELYIEGEFDIEELYKGSLQEMPEVIKFRWSSCGFPAVIGMPYLIFTDKSGMTNVCSGSAYFYDADHNADPRIIKLRKIKEELKKRK